MLELPLVLLTVYTYATSLVTLFVFYVMPQLLSAMNQKTFSTAE